MSSKVGLAAVAAGILLFPVLAFVFVSETVVERTGEITVLTKEHALLAR